MSREVSSNEWGRIIHHPQRGVLELNWRAVAMSDPGFMATLGLLALEAERLRPCAILVDAREFRHQFGAGTMEWRDASVIPRYGAAGVRRFAFVVPAGAPVVGQEKVDGRAVFPTAWFDSVDAAHAWLAGGPRA
jgi:hypothetical protein